MRCALLIADCFRMFTSPRSLAPLLALLALLWAPQLGFGQGATLPGIDAIGPVPTTAPSFQSQIDQALGRVPIPITLSDSGVTWIDSAVVATQLRLRTDFAYNWQLPDRGELLWAQTGNRGPTQAETSVDYQELSLYGEYSLGGRFGLFGELPLRLVNPDVNPNTGGLADGNAGIKFGLVQTPELLVTLQLRTIFPSGSGHRGLGARHVSIEPGVLGLYKVGKYMAIEGEFRDLIPLNGTPGFAGNVIRYGSGLTYSLFVLDGGVNVQSVAEVVGWTLSGGDVTIVDGPGLFHTSSAAGDTIINSTVGVRTTMAQFSSFYFGYSRAITGDHWYTDMLRVELRQGF